MLTEGQKAPLFTLPNQNGVQISLKDYAGKKVVLYFYPKDQTPTCIKQACNMRDNINRLLHHGIQVFGISVDSVKSHKNFETKQLLNFPLLADEQKKVVLKYGVWGPKKFMGKTFDGTHRTTFLIDEKGKIAHVISKVKSDNHVAQILEFWGLD